MLECAVYTYLFSYQLVVDVIVCFVYRLQVDQNEQDINVLEGALEKVIFL